MLETPHVLVGAAIATKVANPALAIPLSFLSHFILEKIPHWNPHLNTETEKYGRPVRKSIIIVVIDVVLSLTIGFYIASQVLPDTKWALLILLCCFLAALPDIIEGPYFFLGFRKPIIKKWIQFQKSLQEDTNIIPGLLTQLITIIVTLWWIFK